MKLVNKEELKYTLDEAGIRPSVQRMAVISYLESHRSHPTVDEIYRALSPDYPTLSRTTIYNTLKLFVERGVVNEIDIDQANARFDFTRGDRHAHFLCRGCGAIFDMKLAMPSPGNEAGSFEVESVNVYFKGLCPECKKKQHYGQ